ncbi:MAG: hypothetical protein OXI15_02175 [Chromatiales bacterium]|nr:hypothetical protein [Chromatiales bacterium]
METIAPWLTPALVLALFAWLKRDMRDLRNEFRDFRKEIRAELGDFRKEAQDFRSEVNTRFDGVTREIGDLRERMAKLEGALEGFIAGRRDRDAAA